MEIWHIRFLTIRKIYFEGSAGIPIQDIWLEFRDAHNQNIRITGYPTEKNPALLARIIEASSHPGDLVLDCFSSSGTTLAVASQLGRRWIGIDNSSEAIATTLRRFSEGLKPMGDFVSREPPPDQELPTQTLFSWTETEMLGDALQSVPFQEQKITKDFSLYTTSAYRGELEDILQQK
jgi:adenine-specific DNA-methyltransferase